MTTTRRTILAMALGLAFATPAMAGSLAPPTGEVILVIDGKVSNTNDGKTAAFDLAMLEALPKVKFQTTTPWTEGKSEFEGVALKDLLAAAGATGANLTATALNDYAAPLAASDQDVGALVAYKFNGQYMSVREKGPLWIIYPFDDKPELKSEIYYSRSVWQLSRLTSTD